MLLSQQLLDLRNDVRVLHSDVTLLADIVFEIVKLRLYDGLILLSDAAPGSVGCRPNRRRGRIVGRRRRGIRGTKTVAGEVPRRGEPARS